MKAIIKVRCPYCGQERWAETKIAKNDGDRIGEGARSDAQMEVCGGCDKLFVFEARIHYTVTTGTIGGDLQPAEQPEPEAPAIVVPDWTKAPDWAQWWAADGDGSGNWYECVPAPTADGDYWENPSGERYKLSNDQYGWSGDYWYRSLEQRPQAVSV